MTSALTTTWPQVLSWRMRRHLLDPPGKVDAVDIVRRLCGVQAQVPSAAALAVVVRQDEPDVAAVDQALRDRRLMRTWAMRGTLHLLAPDEAGAYLALIAAARTWEKPSWQRAFGVNIAEMAALTDAVAEVLDGHVLTRDELVAAVGAHLGHSNLEEQLRSGWGTVLKPISWRGVLCQATTSAPNRVAFARPDQWLPDWAGIPEPEDAARVAIPAYLRAHGPAPMQAFDAWLTRNASKKAALRGWFAGLDDVLVSVEVEGASAYLLAEDLDDLAATSPTDAVRLLPGFDQYVLGPGTGAAEIIAPERRSEVSRTAGWISPVVVAGGRVVGVWEASDGKVDVRLFEEADPVAPEALDAEVERTESVLVALSS